MTTRRTRRPLLAAATFLPTLALAPCAHAIITYGSSDPTHNTTAPTGALANSGWQWEGAWDGSGGSYLGTAIAPQYFITAAHIGSSANPFVLNGISYPATPFPDGSANKSVPGTDLIVWHVSGTFSSYAPLWDTTVDGSEVGGSAVMIGRGTQRGAAIRLPQSTGELRGWEWGPIDAVERWGTNIITSSVPTNVGGTVAPTLHIDFDANPADRPGKADASGYSGPDEAIISDKDSGGAVFVKSPSGAWKLAGINWSVTTGFAYASNSNQIGAGQALFDAGGFYQANTTTHYTDTTADAPAYSVASSISANLAAIAATLAGSPAVWNADASANWATQSDWWTSYDGSTPLPNAAGSKAIFGRVITAPRTVSLTSSKTVGSLTFESPQSYTLAGSQLVLDNATSPASINVTVGSHTISAPVQLNSNTTVTITPDATNSSKLSLTGPLTASPGVTLTKSGAGPMDVTTLRIPSLAVTAGTLRVLPNGTSSSTSNLSSLSVTGGNLDLADNDLVLNYSTSSPADTIRQYLLTGRNSGAWNGTGLISSSAAADPRTAIAYVEASTLLNLSGNATATWSGQTVSATSLLLKYTWYGDANLDGKVTPDDYALLDRGLAKSLTGWVNGDFNYDNVINSADYALIDKSFLLQSGTLSPSLLAEREAQFGQAYVSSLLASVPEPTPAIACLFATSLFTRRRRI